MTVKFIKKTIVTVKFTEKAILTVKLIEKAILTVKFREIIKGIREDYSVSQVWGTHIIVLVR